MNRLIRLLLPFTALALLFSGLASPSEKTTQQAVFEHFQAGQKAMQAGELDSAVTEFQQVLELMPGLMEAKSNLGLAYFLQGNYQEAIDELRLVARERPNLPAAKLFLGFSHMKLGGHAEAIPLLEEAIKAEPLNAEIRSALATSYAAEDRYGDAAREYRALFARTENQVDAWYQLGKAYFELSRKISVRISRQFRDTPWGGRFAGDLLSMSDRGDAAADYYQAAVTADPDQPGLHAALGETHLMAGRPEDAEASFLQELELPPGPGTHRPRSHLGLAEILLSRGDAAGALSRLNSAWELTPAAFEDPARFPRFEVPPDAAAELIGRLGSAPETPPLHYLLAALYRAAGQPDAQRQKEQAWQQAQKDRSPRIEDLCGRLGPSACEGDPHLTSGKALLTVGKLEEASQRFAQAGAEDPEPLYWLAGTYRDLSQQAFGRVQELAPEGWRAQQLRAESHRLRNEDDEAVSAYLRAIELKPDDPELHESLGELFFLRNDLNQAEQELVQALEIDPSRSSAYYVLGRVFSAKQQPETAVEPLEIAVRLEPARLEAQKALGQAYLRLGRVDEAVAALEKSIDVDDNGDVFYALYQAYRRRKQTDLAQQALAKFQEIRSRAEEKESESLKRWLE